MIEMNWKIAFIVGIIVLVSGCTQQKPINSVVVQGVEYTFSTDIRYAAKVPVNNDFLIRELILNNKEMNVIFDCSVPEEKPRFSVVGYNVVTKIQYYYVNSLFSVAKFEIYCYVGNKWYNSTDSEIEKPELSGATLWLKGPKTGANETSVILDNNTVIIQGATSRNLELAGDAFSLAFLGVRSEVPK